MFAASSSEGTLRKSLAKKMVYQRRTEPPIAKSVIEPVPHRFRRAKENSFAAKRPRATKSGGAHHRALRNGLPLQFGNFGVDDLLGVETISSTSDRRLLPLPNRRPRPSCNLDPTIIQNARGTVSAHSSLC
jgi:hypothetical protein